MYALIKRRLYDGVGRMITRSHVGHLPPPRGKRNRVGGEGKVREGREGEERKGREGDGKWEGVKREKDGRIGRGIEVKGP